MLPKVEVEDDLSDLRELHESFVAEMLAEPRLTNEEKQGLLGQSALPDEEWEPTVLPAGAEPLSVTVIKMRRGECDCRCHNEGLQTDNPNDYP